MNKFIACKGPDYLPEVNHETEQGNLQTMRGVKRLLLWQSDVTPALKEFFLLILDSLGCTLGCSDHMHFPWNLHMCADVCLQIHTLHTFFWAESRLAKVGEGPSLSKKRCSKCYLSGKLELISQLKGVFKNSSTSLKVEAVEGSFMHFLPVWKGEAFYHSRGK